MNELAFFETGSGSIEVRIEHESVWLSQEQMARLFERERSVITKHLRNVFRDEELVEESVCAKFAQTAGDGKTYQTRFFNLDAILSVGYRVNSKRGVQFRQWASRILKDYLVRGYALDRQRLEHNARELEAALRLVRRTLSNAELAREAGSGLAEIVVRYTQTFLWLQRYDEGLLTDPRGHPGAAVIVLLQGCVASLGLVAAGAYPVDLLLSDYLPFFLLLGFSEAWLSGMTLTLLVVYFPEWVASFDDRSYFGSK